MRSDETVKEEKLVEGGEGEREREREGKHKATDLSLNDGRAHNL